MIECDECGGSGICPWCDGTAEQQGEPCDDCEGSGRCAKCKGEGEIPKDEAQEQGSYQF